MSQEVVPSQVTEQALIARATADAIEESELVVPRLKIGQALTDEVKEGDARPGDLIHSLTGEVYGSAVELVIVQAFKGRALREKGQFYSANNTPVVPDNWPERYRGLHFVDVPDAEEQFKARANAGDVEWGSGPPIYTTHNFVGLVLRDGELEDFPVRVSLSRGSAKEGKNWVTMLKIARAPWDLVFELSTQEARSRNNDDFFKAKVKQLRKTTPEERQAALEVAQLINGGDTAVVFDEGQDDEEGGRPAQAPDSNGGLEL